MPNNLKNLFEKDQTVIFKHYPWGKEHGRMEYEDGTICIVNDDSVDLKWLEGYKNRDDRVEFEDIVAIVDLNVKEQSRIGPYVGQFRFIEH